MTTVVTVLGVASAAGLNAYATLLVVGLMVRFDLVPLHSATARFFADPWVLLVLALLYLVEFVADKIPAVDHVWDAVHTVIRPLAGAAAAVAIVSGRGEGWVVLAAVIGGATSLLFHGGKAGGRLAVTASTGGTGNWLVSLLEDGAAFVVAVTAMLFPVLVVVLIVGLVIWLVRRRRRRRAYVG